MKNKTALITGASSGIGEACARLLAQQGAKLILASRRKDRLAALAESLENDFSCRSLILGLDVSKKSDVEAQLLHLPDEWKTIDILINNAGLALGSDPMQTGDIDKWEQMIDTNIKGLLYVSRCIIPQMIERGSGHIVNIGSIAGQECYPNGNVYCASKHAVRAITKSMRMDLLGTSVRVSELAPGAVETEFSVVRWNDEQKAKDFYQDFDPLIAQDVAEAVLFCLTRPPHVDIAELTIMPTAQASANHISRKGKQK
ncbi:short chain dehydrogenase/reductase family oxidoreductase [Legionella birminghamensis]|uniref:Short chain dehydrogenase/reductase family oxidoreductase n=1 Tax=Legionella birminghamensis TaxID=28083 RepID=A0A378IAJ0_9GAMM|nr:SDR family oxidoreductase [Legionella birminghamensis]KTC69319.1 short chain dehydrogenase/reductase family oxidoreductase [Legionella birminghamensis]STX31581.1 short chain dehydrogenase/reductase family oxidoreductase [Legionella birminghamensis]